MQELFRAGASRVGSCSTSRQIPPRHTPLALRTPTPPHTPPPPPYPHPTPDPRTHSHTHTHVMLSTQRQHRMQTSCGTRRATRNATLLRLLSIRRHSRHCHGSPRRLPPPPPPRHRMSRRLTKLRQRLYAEVRAAAQRRPHFVRCRQLRHHMCRHSRQRAN